MIAQREAFETIWRKFRREHYYTEPALHDLAEWFYRQGQKAGRAEERAEMAKALPEMEGK